MREIGVFVPKFGTSRINIFRYIQIEQKIILAYLLWFFNKLRKLVKNIFAEEMKNPNYTNYTISGLNYTSFLVNSLIIKHSFKCS